MIVNNAIAYLAHLTSVPSFEEIASCVSRLILRRSACYLELLITYS